MNKVDWSRFWHCVRRWGIFLAKAEGFGAIAGALIAVGGAWWLTAGIQSDLDAKADQRRADQEKALASQVLAQDQAERLRSIAQEQTNLAFSVSKEASEAVGQVFWNGQRLLGFLDPVLEQKASRSTWDGRGMAQQLIDSRLAFDRSIRDWKISSGTWGLLMRFFNSPQDTKPTDQWRSLDERCERYIACIQKRYSEPSAKLGTFELADCSHFFDGIQRSLEAWSDTLRTRAASLAIQSKTDASDSTEQGSTPTSPTPTSPSPTPANARPAKAGAES